MNDSATGGTPAHPTHPNYPTAEDLRARRREILEAAARHRARRLSVIPPPLEDQDEAEAAEGNRFPGSAALLASFTPDASVLDHIALAQAMEKLFGVPVAVVAEGSPAARRLVPHEVQDL